MAALLGVEDLTDEQIKNLNRTFIDGVKEYDDPGLEELYRAYLVALATYGVMCPHPESMRVFGDDARWYECGICGCAVIR